MTDVKKLVPGIPEGEMQRMPLSETELASMKKDRAAIAALDAIDYPLEAVLYGHNKWTYRNDAYRAWNNKMDIEGKERLEKMITEKKRI